MRFHVTAAFALSLAGALAFCATHAAASELGDFGRCLTSEGAVFYGASWCPHCKAQKDTLGEALPGVHYVECAEGGKRQGNAKACEDAKVDSYPTWVFKDGSRLGGAQSLETLAKKTGCSLTEKKTTYHHGGSGRIYTRPTGPKGPRIIEIPPE
jgi:glutaredoxin